MPLPGKSNFKLSGKISLAIVLLIGIVLSIKSIREPDLWWQLRTGEWMLENHAVTKQDVFSFSYEGVEWVNVKWGYEILQAVVSKAGGPEFIPLLQIIFTVLLLLILMRTTLILGRHIKDKNFKIANGTAFILMLFLWITEWRMTGRPETISHVMTASFALLFLQHRIRPSRWIFLIIPLQLLWANMHEAFGIGIVLSLMFTAAFWLEARPGKIKSRAKKDPAAFHLMLTATILSILAVAINPRGFELTTHPFEIFSQLGANKYTIELYSFVTSDYWTYRSVLAIVLVAISLFLARKKYLIRKKTRGRNKDIHSNNPGPGYWLFVPAMLYLGLSASRNIPFLMIAITPLLAIFAEDFIIKSKKQLLKKISAWGIPILALVFYLLVVSGKYYELFNPRDRYGMDINVEKTPVGAAGFIRDNNIDGRAFTDFLSSSYLLWRLQPEFKSYIDLRDLDIFPEVFFKNNFMLYEFPERVFHLADADMNFDYIVLLNSPTFRKVHQYLLTGGDFELVYGDNLASVYLGRTDNYEGLIRYYGYNKGSHDVYKQLKPTDVHLLPKVFTLIFNPFYKFREYDDLDYPTYRMLYYKYLGIDQPANIIN